jgi:hypothetical protein
MRPVLRDYTLNDMVIIKAYVVIHICSNCNIQVRVIDLSYYRR